jgi:RNA-directed DNA polymerase
MTTQLIDLLSRELYIPKNDLIYLIKSAPYRYKVFEIDKKESGKKRVIAQPAKELKPLQHWVMRNILSEFPIHHAATAYRKGRNISDNAYPHAAHKYLCKLDFKGFFPSIRSSDFVKFMSESPLGKRWAHEEIEYLARILFWRRRREGNLILSIGAPSSPLVSNILLFELDTKIASLCASHGVTYTRYADDLTFSADTSGTLSEIERAIPSICTSIGSPRLLLNRSKTVHASRKGKRQVTGLTLTNEGTVSLGRERKREISAAVHHFKLRRLTEEQIQKLGGLLAFAKSVEPTFLQKLAAKYGARTITSLISRRSESR